jgi:urease accessory protein
MTRLVLSLIMVLAAAASPAEAHTIGSMAGFMNGFTHPFSGLDHIFAMVAVGFYAAHLGGRSICLVPLAFMAMMAVGGAIGAVGISIPFVEIGIALSVIILGAAVAVRLNLSTAAAMFRSDARFRWQARRPIRIPVQRHQPAFPHHGRAHETERKSRPDIGLGIGLVAERYSERLAQVSGAGIAIVGFLLSVRIL